VILSPAVYYLKPGFLYVSRDPVKILTVLGSCVGVFMFDARLRYGGANHVIYPRSRGEQERSTKYADVAVDVLVRFFLEWGSRRDDLLARLVGGASQVDSTASDEGARRNVVVVEEELNRRGVSVSERVLGGHAGRKVIFDTGTGKLDYQVFSKGEGVL
jgi:chemotaxis protein CheD